MKQLAEALMKSHDQIQEAKQTEIDLRDIIRNYDEKFTTLQKAMKDTNLAYEEFRSEMTKVCFKKPVKKHKYQRIFPFAIQYFISQVTNRTTELEKETTKWQNRWEESNTALTSVRSSHIKLQSELIQAEENLTKMKSLCRALQTERKQLLEEIKAKSSQQVSNTVEPESALKESNDANSNATTTYTDPEKPKE